MYYLSLPRGPTSRSSTHAPTQAPTAVDSPVTYDSCGGRLRWEVGSAARAEESLLFLTEKRSCVVAEIELWFFDLDHVLFFRESLSLVFLV